MSPGESGAGGPLNPRVRSGGGGAVTDGIRAPIELVPGEGSRTVGIDLLSVEQLSIVGDLRYVCWVGISNTGNLPLSLASLSDELSYFRILVPEYQRVIPLR